VIAPAMGTAYLRELQLPPVGGGGGLVTRQVVYWFEPTGSASSFSDRAHAAVFREMEKGPLDRYWLVLC